MAPLRAISSDARFRVLFVEDSPEDAELLQMQLEEAGLVADYLRVDDEKGLLHALVEGAELLVGLGQFIALYPLLLTDDPTAELFLLIRIKQVVGLGDHLLQTGQIVGKWTEDLAQIPQRLRLVRRSRAS